MKKPEKSKILAMRMVELPLGRLFRKWFVWYPNGNKRYSPLESSLTVREFFKQNQTLIRDVERFNIATNANPNALGFSVQSNACLLLQKFLKEKGFSHEDWPMLAPTHPQMRFFPLEDLDLKSKKKMPYITFCGVKHKTDTFRRIGSLFFREENGVKLSQDPTTITVGQILKLKQSDIVGITGRVGSWRIPYDQVQQLRTSILKAQKKLATHGFAEQDGPFMAVSFKRGKPAKRLGKIKKEVPLEACAA